MYYICIIISHTFDDIAHFDVKKIIYNQRKNIHVCCNNNKKIVVICLLFILNRKSTNVRKSCEFKYLLLKYLNKKYLKKKHTNKT